MNIKRVGVDLEKAVFQVHGVDCRGKVVLRNFLTASSATFCADSN